MGDRMEIKLGGRWSGADQTVAISSLYSFENVGHQRKDGVSIDPEWGSGRT